MTSELSARIAHPTPDCLKYEALLPVLDEPAADLHAVARARQHLATCAYCQRQVEVYAGLEASLRHHLGELPRHAPDEIMRQIAREHAADETLAAAGGERSETPTPLRPVPPARRAARWARVSAFGSVAAALIVAVMLAALLAQHRLPGTRQPTTNTARIGALDNTDLSDVAMVSPTEGWAVGSSQQPATGGGVTDTAMLLHLQGGTWTRLNLPHLGHLLTISMLSPTEGWAAGQNVLLHYNGQTWAPSSLPTNIVFISQIQEVSPTAVWAVDGSPYGVLHYDGSRWQYQPLPASLRSLGANQSFSLNQLLMLSTTDGWAVGTLDQIDPTQRDSSGGPLTIPSTVVLHYQHGTWQEDTRLPKTNLTTLSSAPDGTLLAAGYAAAPYHPVWDTHGLTYLAAEPIIMTYSHGTWQRDDAPIQSSGANPDSIESAALISGVSARDPWLVLGTDPLTHEPRLLHLTGGRWSPVALPVIAGIRQMSLVRIAAASSAETWGVGETYTCPNAQGPTTCDGRLLILHDLNGTWTVALH